MRYSHTQGISKSKLILPCTSFSSCFMDVSKSVIDPANTTKHCALCRVERTMVKFLPKGSAPLFLDVDATAYYAIENTLGSSGRALWGMILIFGWIAGVSYAAFIGIHNYPRFENYIWFSPYVILVIFLLMGTWTCIFMPFINDAGVYIRYEDMIAREESRRIGSKTPQPEDAKKNGMPENHDTEYEKKIAEETWPPRPIVIITEHELYIENSLCGLNRFRYGAYSRVPYHTLEALTLEDRLVRMRPFIRSNRVVQHSPCDGLYLRSLLGFVFGMVLPKILLARLFLIITTWPAIIMESVTMFLDKFCHNDDFLVVQSVIPWANFTFWNTVNPNSDNRVFYTTSPVEEIESLRAAIADRVKPYLPEQDTNMEEGTGILSAPDIPPVLTWGMMYPYIAFLTHDWRTDSLGRGNHERVIRIEEALRETHGLNCWIDKSQIKGGDFRKKMMEGIDRSAVVVVFVTKAYISKVTKGSSADNCKVEFDYAVATRTNKRMIFVVMEPTAKKASEWGMLGFEVSGNREYYLDFSDDNNFDRDVSRLADMINDKVLSGQITAPDTLSTLSVHISN